MPMHLRALRSKHTVLIDDSRYLVHTSKGFKERNYIGLKGVQSKVMKYM